MRMVEDRMRGLKMRVPREGLRVKLIPTQEELDECTGLGREIANILVGKEVQRGVIEFSDLT